MKSEKVDFANDGGHFVPMNSLSRELFDGLYESFAPHGLKPQEYMDEFFGQPPSDIVPHETSRIKKFGIGSAIGSFAVVVGYGAWYEGTKFIEAFRYLH